MKSDITRFTFKPEKHYSGVRMQQGRVQLDADWNEQIDIVNHRIETGTQDIIGACGAPENNAGFELFVEDSKLKIKAGRFYVDGMLCENENDVDAEAQPHLPGTPLPDTPGDYIAYLDVWQSLITAVEDPSLREVALGVADTTTRTQTVWQVKLLGPKAEYGDKNNCEKNFQAWTNSRPIKHISKLAARVEPGDDLPADPAFSSPLSGFRGAQNQLYRVEIHRSGTGTDNPPTFKWARDNASFVRGIKMIEEDIITLTDTGRDDLQNFKAGQWIEIINDKQEVTDFRGVLVRVKGVTTGAVLTIELESATGTIPSALLPEEAARGKWKVRGWDHPPLRAEIPFSIQQWIPLEDGIEVLFNAGYEQFQPGDYWLIPARTATGGQIEWPIDVSSTKQPIPQERFGPYHHYCPLALLKLTGSTWSVEQDCRRLFSPLTEQLSFFYVSGDGQEALPGKELARPLQVGVTNNARPVAGAKVKFTVATGAGNLLDDQKNKHGLELTVSTGQKEDGELFGIAQCFYELDASNQVQQLKAAFLDAAGNETGIAIRFNVNLSRAPEVEYKVIGCGDGQNESPTVQSLLRKLVDGWPEMDDRGNTTIKYVFDTLLCKFDADKLPFQHDCASKLYPPETQSVGQALKALCDLAAKHVIYEDRECSSDQATVRTLLEEALGEAWADFDGDGRVTVQDILQALLCRLDAATLPFAPPLSCSNGIYAGGIQSVGAALEALCNLQARHVTYQFQSQPTWQTTKDALDFLAQNAVTPSGTISGTFGPELETNPVVEFVGAEFDKFRIPQVIPTTPGAKLSWSHQVEVTANQRMRYHFNISKDQSGIFGYEIRFIKFGG